MSTGVPEVVRSAINVDTRGVYGELVCNLQDVNLQSLVLHSGPSPIVATTRMTNVNLGNDRLDIGKIAVSTQNKVLDGRDAYDVSYAHNKHKPTSQVSVELVWEDPPFLSSSQCPASGPGYANETSTFNTVKYSILGNEDFTIDEDTGEVTAVSIDREGGENIAITVRVTNIDTGETKDRTFTFRVTDTNDNSMAIADSNPLPNEVARGALLGELVGYTAIGADADATAKLLIV